MKKGKVFFHPIDGAGALTISWSSGPKGNAIEAKKGSGVGFFSEKGDLLCVIFDEIQSKSDHQILEFERYSVQVTVKSGQVEYSVTQPKARPRLRKRPLKQKRSLHAARGRTSKVSKRFKNSFVK